jgi:hypothetical protein
MADVEYLKKDFCSQSPVRGRPVGRDMLIAKFHAM